MLGCRTYGRCKAKISFLCLSPTSVEFCHLVRRSVKLQVPVSSLTCRVTLQEDCQPATLRNLGTMASPRAFSWKWPSKVVLTAPLGSSLPQQLILRWLLLSSFFLLAPETNVIYISSPCMMNYFPIILLNRVKKKRQWKQPKQLIIYNWGK
jgi:hypothetical protein